MRVIVRRSPKFIVAAGEMEAFQEGNRNAGNRTAEPQIHSRRREKSGTIQINRNAGNRTANSKLPPGEIRNHSKEVIVMRVIVRRSSNYRRENREPFQGG